MREIKFRVWHKKYKKWLTDNDYGTHCSSNWMMDVFTGKIIDFVDDNNSYSPTFYPNYYMGEHCIIDESPFGVQQYIGLKDKNGKEIDGASYPKEAKDILLFCRWDQSNAWFVFDEDLNQDGNGYYWLEIREHCEVIGNIYENPELLDQ